MRTKLFTITLLTILFAVNFYAADNSHKRVTNEQIEENLIVGLNSDNLGLKVSSAYMLGEIEPSEKAIIMLMKTLREDNDERVRVMAALTLIKLEDERGINIVKNECKYNDNCKTRKMCKLFYASYMNKKYSLIEETRDTLYATLTLK